MSRARRSAFAFLQAPAFKAGVHDFLLFLHDVIVSSTYYYTRTYKLINTPDFIMIACLLFFRFSCIFNQRSLNCLWSLSVCPCAKIDAIVCRECFCLFDFMVEVYWKGRIYHMFVIGDMIGGEGNFHLIVQHVCRSK